MSVFVLSPLQADRVVARQAGRAVTHQTTVLLLDGFRYGRQESVHAQVTYAVGTFETTNKEHMNQDQVLQPNNNQKQCRVRP